MVPLSTVLTVDLVTQPEAMAFWKSVKVVDMLFQSCRDQCSDYFIGRSGLLLLPYNVCASPHEVLDGGKSHHALTKPRSLVERRDTRLELSLV